MTTRVELVFNLTGHRELCTLLLWTVVEWVAVVEPCGPSKGEPYPDRVSPGEFGCFQIRSILSPAFVQQPTTAAA